MRDFNFFSPYLGKKKEIKNKNLYFGIVGGILVLIIAGTFVFNSINILLLKRDIKDLNADLSKPETVQKLKQSEDLNKKQEIMNKYFEGINVIFNSINDNNAVSSDKLTSLASTLPSGTSFKNMSIDGQTVSIQGTAKNRVSIGEFQHNLKQLNWISNVQVSSITGGEDGTSKGDYSFVLKCSLKDVDKNENK